MLLPSLKKAQTFPVVESIQIGFASDNNASPPALPTTHTLITGDCVYVLKRRTMTSPDDMRQCDVFVIVEMRQPVGEGAKPIAIGHPLLRYNSPLLTQKVLGFRTEILGEGELVLSTGLAVIDPQCITSTTEIFKFDLGSEMVPQIPHVNYWCRYRLNVKKKGDGPRITEFEGPVVNPGDDKPISLTCIPAAHPNGQEPYSPNLEDTQEIWCHHCNTWLHMSCCKSLGKGSERWISGAKLADNLGRAAILRGRWWAKGERSDWMLGGSGLYLNNFRSSPDANNTSDVMVRHAFGNDAILDEYPEFDCEFFECPACQGRI